MRIPPYYLAAALSISSRALGSASPNLFSTKLRYNSLDDAATAVPDSRYFSVRRTHSGNSKALALRVGFPPSFLLFLSRGHVVRVHAPFGAAPGATLPSLPPLWMHLHQCCYADLKHSKILRQSQSQRWPQHNKTKGPRQLERQTAGALRSRPPPALPPRVRLALIERCSFANNRFLERVLVHSPSAKWIGINPALVLNRRLPKQQRPSCPPA